jgi:Domain of unknown function (DUF1508)
MPVDNRSTSKTNAEKGIEAIKTHAPGATVEEPARLASVGFR